MSIKELIDSVNWEKGDGLVPAIVQDAESGDVLMLAYMSPESLKASYESNKVTFYSRVSKHFGSRAKRLETS